MFHTSAYLYNFVTFTHILTSDLHLTLNTSLVQTLPYFECFNKFAFIQGMKPTSDSVEILGESLTSPSSVEVMDSNSTNGGSVSHHTDDFVSPLELPWSEDKSRY